MRGQLQILLIAALLALWSPFTADAQTFGSWVADAKADSPYAASVNEGGNIFGQYCSAGRGTCVWVMALASSCQRGDKYPVLANVETGAQSLEILCKGELDSGHFAYAFTSFDQVDLLVRQGASVAFAVPLQRDQFRVIRFDLTGAVSALSRLQETAATLPLPVKRGVQDEKL
jgi:hypothetical protein